MSYPLPILRIILLGLLVSLTLGWSGLAQAETCFGLPDTDPNVCSGAGACISCSTIATDKIAVAAQAIGRVHIMIRE